jgi:DNA recombination protein RmuC
MDATAILFTLCGLFGGVGLGWMLLFGKLARVHAQLALLRERLENAAQELEQTRGERTLMHERAVTAEADKRAVEQRLQEQQEQLRLEFKNTSQQLFENITQKFSTQSEKQIGDLLNPLRERLGEFQKLVVDSFGTQGKEQHTLKSEIEKIVLQTDSLTKALRGDVKVQGNWGEVILERILEESGLRKDSDYIVQGADMGLSAADGSRQMPDVIVNLPEKKHIVIDSKLSLVAYERYCSEADETAGQAHVKDFLRSVKAHVNGLGAKNYQSNDKLSTPDFVLLFMPIEGAYALAMQQDPQLHHYAWSKRIVIVCASTLFATLRTIASLWRIEQQNQNAQEIARQGGALYDKFVGFIEDMNGIEKQIFRLNNSYEEAMNKLSKGTGNLVSRAEKLKQLGVKTTKQLAKTGQADEGEDNIVLLSGTENA